MSTRSSLVPVPLLTSLSASGAPFRYAEDQAPAIANPVFATTMSEARINELLFSGLYTDNKDLATSPLLAEGAELSEDFTELTVSVRQDVRWHDGSPFTAEDVVFTIEAMKDRGTLSTEAGRVAWIDKAEVIDAYTLKLTFAHPEARPEDKLFFKILPKHGFDSTTLKRSDPFRANPIGTGAYTLANFNDDNSISLMANDNYNGTVRLDEIVMREVSDKNYQAKLLLYESLEALVRVLPRDLAVLQNDRKVELYPYQTNSWWYLGFNMDRSTYQDPKVRQALAQLVDVEALLAPVGTGDILSGPFVKSSPFYNHDVRSWTHAPMDASALLEEAGYIQESGNWSKDGTPLEIKIYAHKSLESSQEVVINLQSQWQAAGIGVDVDFLDEARWKAMVWKDREFDVILSQWSFDRNEDVREQFHSNGSRNFTGYVNHEVDELLDMARTTTDPQEKKAAMRKIHSIVRDDSPMIFLWTLDSYSAMSTSVRNVVIHPFYFFTWATDWQMR